MKQYIPKWSIGLLLLFAAGLSPSLEASQIKPAYRRVTKRNLLLITIDTLRADHLGCYGYKRAQTPNLDALARDGARFETAYAVVPTTLPSHTTMMTGSYPMKTGMHDFSGNRLSPGEPTLAGILKAQSYHTGAVVGAAVLDHRFGLDSGFDFYYDHFDFNRLDEANLDAMERPGDKVAEIALEWLKKNKSGKFFLWVHLYDPHYPYTPPAPFSATFKNQPYDGEIAFADAQLGRLFRYLKSNSLYDNTVIAVAGDHGEGLGEHGERTHGFFIYDSTMHVPLIIKMASSSRLQALNRVISQPVSLVDLMPTLLEAVNSAPPVGTQGRSLLPLLVRKIESGSELYTETFLPRLHFDWSELRGIRRQQYHFIDGPKPELYDLARDPHEMINIYAERPALNRELRALLEETIQKNTRNGDSSEKNTLDPAMMDRLKSLGYVAVSGGVNPKISNRELPDPKDRIQVYELISEAITESQHGDLDNSIRNLHQAIEKEPSSVPIHYLLGLDYYRKQDFHSAVEEFSRVLHLSPNYALASYHLGLAYGRLGNWDESISALKSTIELDGTNYSAELNLGVAYSQKRMFDEALAAFRRSITINPDYAAGHKALGQMFLFLGQAGQAVKSLEKAKQLSPNDPEIHAELARAYEANGEPRKAVEERHQIHSKER